MKKREEQIRQSARREFERELRDKMSRFPHQEWKNNAYDKRRRDGSLKRTSNSSDRGRYDSCRPDKKDSRADRKSPSERSNGKDFKSCHVHGAESKHTYDECRNNPKNMGKNKSNDYVKQRRNDTHYCNARRPSNHGEESPSGNDTDAQSDGEIKDDNVT